MFSRVSSEFFFYSSSMSDLMISKVDALFLIFYHFFLQIMKVADKVSRRASADMIPTLAVCFSIY